MTPSRPGLKSEGVLTGADSFCGQATSWIVGTGIILPRLSGRCRIGRARVRGVDGGAAGDAGISEAVPGPRPDPAAMRKVYALGGLHEADVAADPVEQFR